MGALVIGFPGTSFAAIVEDPNCSTHVLHRNDDDSVRTPLGFSMLMGGAVYTDVFVANNGYVAFGRVPPAYFDDNELRLSTTKRTLIAPFLADIDTRNPASDEVTYGQTTYGEHRAFCVNWGTTNGVGYYDSRVDKLNKFQLILVSREDEGFADFDIILNYDQLQWDMEYYMAVNGGAPLPTWVGFTGNAQSVPGSGVLPSKLLDGQSHALTAGSRGTPVPGRYIHEVRNGLPPVVAVVSGTFYTPERQPLAGATAQLCRTDGKCFFALTDTQGRYSMRVHASALDGKPFTLSASPPSGTRLFAPTERPQVTPIANAVVDGNDVTFRAPEPIPADTQLTPLVTTIAPGVPTVYWRDPLHLTTEGCPGATATYTIYSGLGTTGPVFSTGPMTEYARAKYEAFVPPLYPVHGWATLVMQLNCPGGAVIDRAFELYIDPSGDVRNANGNPIRGALVTLSRSDNPQGPFEVVPDGSVIMSPSNRTNPMYSDARGHFGWDTLAGYYLVRAEKPGCTAVGNANQPYAQTDVLPVPPPVTDLDLRLDCSAVPPPAFSVPSKLVVEAQTPAGAVVVYAASAVDATDGPVPASCLPASGSFFPFGTTVVSCTAMNSYGNVGTASFSVTVSDTQPPVLTLPGEDLAAYATSVAGANVVYEAKAVDALEGAITPVCAPPSGATFSPGETKALCEATDSHGNTSRGTFSVHVTYEFGGVLAPLSQGATFKQNQVIPVRFTLTGASAGISTLAVRLFVAKVVGDAVSPEQPAVSAGGGATGNLFMPVGPTGAYQFLLSTKSMTPGAYWLRIDLGDGALHALPITLTN